MATTPRTPWVNAQCERLIGRIRREVLDHVLVMGEGCEHQVLAAYGAHYDVLRPHQARDQRLPSL
ncbi:integrase core domain-containing protein [Lentzea sp. NPDC006480]|uniref:integrase core domain-containing protein n=1 Tax=Lentzea sp. NPDC006480 TaxID=3157176 RepID=UPI0033ADF449